MREVSRESPAVIVQASKVVSMRGIGAGWKEDEWLAYGYGFPPTKERLAQFGDHLEVISRMLGQGRATILYEYPVAEAALARPAPHDPRVAERFELYACGVELANAFGELTDPIEQRRRFVAEMSEKHRQGSERGGK